MGVGDLPASQAYNIPDYGSFYKYTPLYSVGDAILPLTQYYTYTTEQNNISTEITVTTAVTEPKYKGNVQLSFEWSNLPTVVLSPISSIVLTLDGMNVSQEIHPINITQPSGSSLIASFPLIENFYSLASTIRDLHDELVVVKDSFDDTATLSLSNISGQERSLRLSAKYITKDGKLYQIYIPKNGVFSLQLTFGIDYVSV